jgi:hypothetical protein
MSKQHVRISPWLIVIFLCLGLSGSGCRYEITVIDASGCGGTVTPLSDSPGSCQKFTVSIDLGSCEKYSIDGEESTDTTYTEKTPINGTKRIIVVFHAKEPDGTGEVLEPIDLQPVDDGGGGIVIIDNGEVSGDVEQLPEPPKPKPTPPTISPPSCVPVWGSCSVNSDCCSNNCFNGTCEPS